MLRRRTTHSPSLVSRRYAIAAGTAAVVLAGLPGACADPEAPAATALRRLVGPTNVVSAQEHVLERQETFGRLDSKPKPARFDSWGDRFDFVHNNLTCEMQAQIDRADALFVQGSECAERVPHSRFRLAIFGEIQKDGSVDLKLDPDFETDLFIPNIRRRYRIFIDTRGNDDLPGTTVTERDQGLNTGLRRVIRDFRTDIGVKLRWPPVVFTRVDWRPSWNYGAWTLRPSQRVYWESDDGFGAVGAFTASRFFAGRWAFRSSSALRWTEEANDVDEPVDASDDTLGPAGVEWEQSLIVAKINRLIEGRHKGHDVGLKHAASGTGVRLSAFGQSEPEWHADRFRLTFAHRRPLYRNWMFLTIAPEVEWKLRDNWDFIPRLRVGVDMLFWAEAVQGR